MNKLNIQIIFGSTRKGRQGERVFKWLTSLLSQRKDMTCEMLDLRDWPLPFFDEPKSPSQLKVEEYSNEIAKKWYHKISEGDGFIIVTPEYNHSYPAVLKNALDYVSKPWSKKPVAFVSYSDGLAGGVRAIEQLRQVVIDLEMVPIRQMVYLSNFDKLFNETGEMKEDTYNSKASKMTDALLWWANLLKKAREEVIK